MIRALIVEDASLVRKGLRLFLQREDDSLLNARLEWDDAAGKWSAAVEVSNATDKLYYYSMGPALNADGSLFALTGTPALPRTELFTLTRRF